MRYANQIWQAYKNNPAIQDVAETLIGSGVAAGGQLLFTDMDPGEVATSTAIGAALAMGARPIGARVGRAVGKQLDNIDPNMLEFMEEFIPITDKGQKATLHGLKNAYGANEEVLNAAKEMLESKRNYHAIRPDGSMRGTGEIIGSYLGNTRGDNIAQYGFAAISPVLFGNSGSETDETGQGYVQ